MDNTAQAEGSYAAKAGELYANNPYPMDHLFHQSWAAGWIIAMQGMQVELNLYKKAYGRALDQNRDLTRKLEAMQAEYDAFLMEMGY